METVALPSTRGPVRVGELTHPRPPRHLPRQQLSEDKLSKKDEKEMGTKVSDGGDSSEKLQGPSLDQKELSVIEKHQRRGPTQLRAQLRRNSLNYPHKDCEQISQPLYGLNVSSTPQERITALRHVQSSENLTAVSQKERASEQQTETLNSGQKPFSLEKYLDQRRLMKEQVVKDKKGSASVAVNATDFEAAGNQNVNSVHADGRRSPYPHVENQKNDYFDQNASPVSRSFDQNASPVFRSACPNISRLIPHGNGGQDHQSTVASTSNSPNSESKMDGPLESSVKPPTIAPYTSRHKIFLQSLYRRPASSPSSIEKGSSSFSTASSKMSDLDSTGELAPLRHTENDILMKMRENGISSRTDLMKNSERSLKKVREDFESTTVTPIKRGELQSRREVGPSHSTPVSERQSLQLCKVSPQQAFSQSSPVSDISNLHHQSAEKTESGRQPVAELMYCKLKLADKDMDQHSFITLVAPKMNDLLQISTLLTEKIDAEIVRFGNSTPDLVDEISQQTGIPLTMPKLYALPSCGKYSSQELVRISASRLSHQEPSDWNKLVECVDVKEILLGPKEVKHFYPLDYKPPTGERIYRIKDGYRF